MAKTTRSLLLAAALVPLAAACADVRTPTAVDVAAVDGPRAHHGTTTSCNTVSQDPTVVTGSDGKKKVRLLFQVGCTAGVYRVFVKGTLNTSVTNLDGVYVQRTCQASTTTGTVGGCSVAMEVDATGNSELYQGTAEGAVRFHSTDANAVTLASDDSSITFCSTAGCS